LGSGFDASTLVNADMTVYAKWTARTYTVTFKMNDGTNADHAGATVTVPAATIATANYPVNPTRSGYNFAGWNTQADGSGATFTQSTEVHGDMTIYAQ
jgi:uncharacterized repeat protein (TIGR02543 family)